MNDPLTYGPTGIRCGCGKDAHSNLVPCQPDPQPFTPDVVNAIVRDMDDPRYPSQITVFCDECGTEFTGEFMVSAEQSSTERLEVARAYMRAKGWQCDATGDYCPNDVAATF